MLVLAITLLMVTAGADLAVNAFAHDPLIQTDSEQHYAYRALEAGINTYLSTINARPDLVNCSATSTSKTCTSTVGGIKYDTWTQVPDTTHSAGNVPEYYLWTNPQLCFSTTETTDAKCTKTATASKGNFEYLQVMIIGAAGVNGHYLYQSSIANFSPGQGFLTRVFWTNYDVTNLTTKTETCKYDWKDTHEGDTKTPTDTTKTPTIKYKGDTPSDGSKCGVVDFGTTTYLDGPVFSNDSIYISTYKPLFGTPSTSIRYPVEDPDPDCLFVKEAGSSTCATDTSTRYTTENSHHGVATEAMPTTALTLETVAKLDGCVYYGPTTISFYEKTHVQYMNVFSPETKISTKTNKPHDTDNDTTNHLECNGKATKADKMWTGLPAPTSANTGNGVIYVATSTVGTDGSGTCTGNHDNPFDGFEQHKQTTNIKTRAEETKTHVGTVGAQIAKTATIGGTKFTYNYTHASTPKSTTIDAAGKDDCAGDVFVRDADSSNTPSGATAGIAGNLTVAAKNNVIITGKLEYTDCGTTFSSTYHYERTCTYNAGGVNDSLGLIATNFVEVNRPANPNCEAKTQEEDVDGHQEEVTTITCTATASSVSATCSASVSDLTAVLCNPVTTSLEPTKGLVIDAAILALKRSFTVDNYKIGSITGRLYLYGTIDQDFRGPVAETGVSGYNKYYVWDSRLQYVTIPHYLTPDTPSWDFSSSSVVLTTTCPGWPKKYPTGSPLTTPKKMPTAQLISKSDTVAPTGASDAC